MFDEKHETYKCGDPALLYGKESRKGYISMSMAKWVAKKKPCRLRELACQRIIGLAVDLPERFGNAREVPKAAAVVAVPEDWKRFISMPQSVGRMSLCRLQVLSEPGFICWPYRKSLCRCSLLSPVVDHGRILSPNMMQWANVSGAQLKKEAGEISQFRWGDDCRGSISAQVGTSLPLQVLTHRVLYGARIA